MLRVALLCSRRAPGLAFLLHEDERRGRDYELVVGFTTDADGDAPPALRPAKVPFIISDLRAFYAARGAARTDRTVRRAYDERTVEMLSLFRPDVLLLSGYLYIVTAPLLAAYPQRVINVHDSDLTLLDSDGRPRFRGLHATRDAIRAGERETRCTAHLVTEDVDNGPILSQSRGFPVDGRHPYVQRDMMMREAWGPLIVDALLSGVMALP